ncbi:MAG: carbon starvation protein A, partial [Planctomycetales bacterium]|nr:carbon starvation protein A [Planctomycetales bacterium]
MDTLLIALASFVGFIVAYHSYGRWLSRRIFGLDASTLTPSHEMRDDVDYVPTHKQVIFGHHFTSIAGTGPIVGPAIAVFWGWLPALLWVVFGCIFIGAVHDLGTLVVSLRNRGQTVGEIAGRVISPRAKILFLLVLFFSLSVVLAIFGLVIANIFSNYPETVLSVWIAMPIAMAIGYWTYRRHGKLLVPSLVSLVVLYAAIYVGVEYLPISVTQSADTQATAWSGRVDLQVGSTTIASALPLVNPVVAWTVVLMVYCFIASVLPVWLLLQPRDYINSHQLLVALVLLVAGLAVAGISGRAQLQTTTPSRVASAELPEHTPPIFPFLFITIACGACSGFHCLV